MYEANGYQLSPESEQNIHTPTPSQLRKIALRALLLANRMDQLKKVRTSRTINSREPSISWVSRYHDKSREKEIDELVSCLLTRRVLVMPDFDLQTEEAVPMDTWSLRYRHLSQVKKNGTDEEWQGEVSVYSFEWNNTATFAAQYKIGAIPSISQEEIDRTWVLDVQGEIPHTSALTGDELDIESITSTAPTTIKRGIADASAYAHIMDTLENHIAKTAA